MGDRYRVTVEVEVEIEIVDPNVIDRCVQNQDDEGVSQPDERGSGGWRNNYYPLTTAEQVVDMLAYNFVLNGVDDISRLDGWADLTSDAVNFDGDRNPYISVNKI